jgi:5-bromo-4-chloroindolyl phosphate hydrolysis protein
MSKQSRAERERENEERALLSRLQHRVERFRSEIPGDEIHVMEKEAELAKFQPTIQKMKGKKKPNYNSYTYFQSKDFTDYKEYEDEKDRLEKNAAFFKRLLEEKKQLIRELDAQINELDTRLDTGRVERERARIMREQYLMDKMDKHTIDSANVFRMATQDRRQANSHKSPRAEVHPLDRLRAHGPHFYQKFMKEITGRTGEPEALSRRTESYGGRKTRKNKTLKRKKHH